jgi:crotonobetainyl-CoA:carnitine CoA-transferase CaiB-like acyl-CoA transferase
VKNRQRLAERIEAITIGRPCSDWLALFDEAGIPCGPINDYPHALADPQILSRQMVIETDHPTLGRLKALGSPIKLSRTPPDPARRAPRLGEHTDEILAEAGYSAEAIAALRRANAVR